MKMYCIKDVEQAVFTHGAKLHKFYGVMSAHWELEYPDGSTYSKIRKGTGQKFYSKNRRNLFVLTHPNGVSLFRLTDEG